MSAFAVKVKWNRTTYDVSADTADKPSTFKAQLYALTGVPPERQKVMFKARQLGDDDWTTLAALKDGVTITMMGNADAIPQALAAIDLVKNVEDMTDEEKRALVKPPAGLKNLGNTCYMNATLQCLKSVPEFADALEKYPVTLQRAMIARMGEMNAEQSLTASMRDLFRLMNANDEVAPLIFVQLMHTALPHFAARDDHGHPQQQDAGECWTELLRFLHLAKLPATPTNEAHMEAGAAQEDWVTKYFGGKTACTLKCKESDEELPQTSTEDFLTFSCFISQEVKYLTSGLKAKLTEDLTKHSTVLNRDAVWEKTSKVSRLPAYLTVTIMRFFYKEKEKTNAKILKEIKYPFQLDLIDLCTDALKTRTLPHRDAMKCEEDAKLARLTRVKSGDLDERAIKAWPTTTLPYSFDDDVGSNNTAVYDLQAVLTHKGRSSNVGHYVAWVRRDDAWFCCDDDHVYPVNADDIARLSGGGDWHTAYVLLYAPKVITVINEPASAAAKVNGDAEPTVEEMPAAAADSGAAQ